MRAHLVSFFVLVALAVQAPALAADRRGYDSRGGLDRVLPQIRHAMPGTFYDAEGPFFTPDGQSSYRIKWMTPDGRLVWFSVDAHSGQILGGARGGYNPPREPYRRNEGRNNFSDGDNRGWDRDRDRGNWGDRGWGPDPSRDGDDRYDRRRNQDRYPDRDQERGRGRNPGHGPDRDRGHPPR